MKILLIEDEERIALSIKKGLEQERFTVDIALRGEEGYDLASTESYNLIILDLMLPGMNGLEICRRLREENIYTPILILTAKGQIQDKVEGLESGADDYLTKPFSFDELLARVRALIRRPQKMLSPVLSVSDLTLNPATYEVKRGKKSIELSRKEFSILEYLMTRPNQIVSKEQIISHIWNFEKEILPNTVEVYIKNLRRKIDFPFKEKPPLIHTVRGFGYKIGE